MLKIDAVKIKCPECGDTEFQIPENAQDDDFVQCSCCSFEIMLCDLNEIGIQQATDLVLPEVQAELEKALKGLFK